MRVKKVEQPVIFDTDCLSSFAAFPDGIMILKKTLGDLLSVPRSACIRHFVE